MKTIIFIDFWNFQLSWQKTFGTNRPDWKQIPSAFLDQARAKLAAYEDNVSLQYHETRIYASVNPAKKKDKRLHNFLKKTLSTYPGFYVNVKERHERLKEVTCPECYHKITNCPNCTKHLRHSPEKGVDSAIVIDMFRLYFDKAYDIGILVTNDADMKPMVEFLQGRGIRIINATWGATGSDLSNSCWDSFDINKIGMQLKLEVSK